MFKIFKKKPYVHQYLDLPVFPKINLFELFPDNPEKLNHVEIDPNTMVDKEFVNFIKNIPGLRVDFWEGFYTPPGGKIWIHSDQSYFTDIARLNITWGPENSKMIWWEPKKNAILKPIVTNFGVNYLTADEDQCIEIHSAIINKPSLVQTGILHSTYNPGPTGRWTLALPLAEKSNPKYVHFNLAVAMFGNYLSK